MTTVFIIFTLIFAIALTFGAVFAKKKISSMRTELDTLKNQNKVSSEEIADLESAKIDLQNNYDTLEDSERKLYEKLTTLEKKNGALRNNVVTLEEKNKKLVSIAKINFNTMVTEHNSSLFPCVNPKNYFTIVDLTKKLEEASSQNESLSVENSVLADKLARLNHFFVDSETFSRTRDLIAHIEAAHQKNVNGQLEFVKDSIESMLYTSSVTAEARSELKTHMSILENSSFIKSGSYHGIDYFVVSITNELIESVVKKRFGMHITFHFSRFGSKTVDIIGHSKYYSSAVYIKHLFANISEIEANFYKAFGVSRGDGYEGNDGTISPKQVNIAAPYGYIKCHPTFDDKTVYQLSPFVKKEVENVILTIYPLD